MGSAVLGSFMIACSAHGATIFVDPSATGADDGSSWTNAYVSLQTALGAATTSDEIWIKAGVYEPTPGSDRSVSFVVDGFPVYGGFAGTESAVGERDLSTYETVLTGDLSGNDTANFGNRSDNSYHVVRATVDEEGVIIDGVTIRGGNADGSGSGQKDGGGVFIENSEDLAEVRVRIRNFSRIEECSANAGGGGIAGDNVWVELRDIVVSGNRALSQSGSTLIDTGGGGANLSKVTATQCRFEGNFASINGGGMVINFNLESAESSLVSVEFIENVAGETGGGVSMTTDATLTNCLIAQNEAGTINDGTGGGVFVKSAAITLLDSTIADNLAYNDGMSPYPDETGGGVYIGSSTAFVRNTVLWGNRVDDGTTIHDQHIAQINVFPSSSLGASPMAYTLVENYAGSSGYFNLGDDLILHDQIFADPASDNYQHRTIHITNVGDNGNVPDDVNDVDGNNVTNETLPLDLPRKSRILLSVVDLGAYEWCVGDLDGDGLVGPADSGLLLGYWGECPEFTPCPGDLNGDGIVDSGDLGIVLSPSPLECVGYESSLLSGTTVESLAEDYAFESVEAFFAWLDTLDAEEVSAVLEPLL